MSNITFALLTFNEEKRLSFAIKNLIKYGDVIILDGGSTDKTKEIAESLGAKFYARPENTQPYSETSENFNFLKKVTSSEWLYWGYVDNILSKKLLEELVLISKQEKFKAVYAPLYTYLWGNTKNHAHKSYIPVLYHRDAVDFSNARIHSMGDFTGSKSEKFFLPNKAEYAVNHFSTYDMQKFVMGHMRYANTEANEKFSKNVKFSTLKMIAAMIRYMWIYGRFSYKNGTMGLIIILHYAFFRLMAYTRLYELEHNITLENIEKEYSLIKEDLLKDFD